MNRLLLAISQRLDRFAELTGRATAPILWLMLFATFSVVVARYLFDSGAIKLQESVSYMHAAVFMLGFAYTLKAGGHVRVDIIYQKLGARGRILVDLLGTTFLLFPMAGFILYSSIDYVEFSWQLKEGSAEPGGLAYVYLLKTLIPISATLLIVQGLSELARNLHRWIEHG